MHSAHSGAVRYIKLLLGSLKTRTGAACALSIVHIKKRDSVTAKRT